MKIDAIEQLINKANGNAFFVGKADETRIKEIECLLGVSLPESYKWFLRELGHGGIDGVEIFGNGLGETPSCVKSTESWRRYGLPLPLVVIEDEGEDSVYCLDTSRLINNECPIIDWEQNIGIGKVHFLSFLDFLKARFMEYLKYT